MSVNSRPLINAPLSIRGGTLTVPITEMRKRGMLSLSHWEAKRERWAFARETREAAFERQGFLSN